MKFHFSTLLVLGLATQGLASTWFGKAAYNKWHETELERWLSDNNVPYPSPADRKDLENLVKSNWPSKVGTPYNDWDTQQLQHYLKSKGYEAKKGADQTKDGLVAQVKTYWSETEQVASEAYGSVKDWVFDSWTESQLKAFCDKHGIPSPQPRKRDTLLTAVRENYETVAQKLNEAVHYPGDWLYESWSESDLKEFLDTRGIPAPQGSTRNKLIASVRRNARVASLNAKEAAASASSSAAAAQESLSDTILDSWSDSKLKEWADKNGIKVPQGSKRNELLAIARKHRASLLDDTVASSASSAFGAATSNAGNAYAKATDVASEKIQQAFDLAISEWSDSRLKAFLDARGVPVPSSGKKDDLVAAVRLQAHKASTGYSAWTFDTWTTENIKKWLATQSDKTSKKIAKKADASRDEVTKQANEIYSSASKSGGTAYASVTSYMATQTDSAKADTFDSWSQSDLKSYLDSYGIPTYQGTTLNELKAAARRNANYFRYGTTTPSGTILAVAQEYVQWAYGLLMNAIAGGRKEAAYQATKAGDYVKEGATSATNRAQEAAQRAGDKIKEEL